MPRDNKPIVSGTGRGGGGCEGGVGVLEKGGASRTAEGMRVSRGRLSNCERRGGVRIDRGSPTTTTLCTTTLDRGLAREIGKVEAAASPRERKRRDEEGQAGRGGGLISKTSWISTRLRWLLLYTLLQRYHQDHCQISDRTCKNNPILATFSNPNSLTLRSLAASC